MGPLTTIKGQRLKYRARWRRIGTYQETFEAVIEADSLEELEDKFDSGEFVSFLMTEQHIKDTDRLDGPSYEEVKQFEQIN